MVQIIILEDALIAMHRNIDISTHSCTLIYISLNDPRANVLKKQIPELAINTVKTLVNSIKSIKITRYY